MSFRGIRTHRALKTLALSLGVPVWPQSFMVAFRIVAAEKIAAWLLFIGEHINPCGHLFDNHGGLRYSAKALINRAATGLLKWWMFPTRFLANHCPPSVRSTARILSSRKVAYRKAGTACWRWAARFRISLQGMHSQLTNVTK